MVPIGGIIQWPRPIVEIPSNYQLCDGSNGTPDMRDQFVIGSGGAHAVNDTGGELSHIHEVLNENHVHAEGVSIPVAGAGPGNAWDAAFDSNGVQADGTAQPTETLPPFHSLFFIQRMS